MNLEIIVVANHKRKPLIIPFLSGKPYKIHYAEDYKLPENFKPADGMAGLVTNHTGTYRCFRGHQDALSIAEGDNILILEDDAVPNNDEWFQKVIKAIPLLDSFEVVSFHGRQRIQPFANVSGYRDYLKPILFPVWMVAALAYMIKKKNVPKYLEYKYNGRPWDILIYQDLSFCVLEKSIFDHNLSEGSLIDI